MISTWFSPRGISTVPESPNSPAIVTYGDEVLRPNLFPSPTNRTLYTMAGVERGREGESGIKVLDGRLVSVYNSTQQETWRQLIEGMPLLYRDLHAQSFFPL